MTPKTEWKNSTQLIFELIHRYINVSIIQEAEIRYENSKE